MSASHLPRYLERLWKGLALSPSLSLSLSLCLCPPQPLCLPLSRTPLTYICHELKMTYKEKTSDGSSPPCSVMSQSYVCIYTCVCIDIAAAYVWARRRHTHILSWWQIYVCSVRDTGHPYVCMHICGCTDIVAAYIWVRRRHTRILSSCLIYTYCVTNTTNTYVSVDMCERAEGASWRCNVFSHINMALQYLSSHIYSVEWVNVDMCERA